MAETKPKEEKIELEEEDLFEIEKKEIIEPEFVEVKPKKSIEEKKEVKKIKEEELTEWKPVEEPEKKETVGKSEEDESIEWTETEFVEVKPKKPIEEKKEGKKIPETNKKEFEEVETVEIQPIETEREEIEPEIKKETEPVWEPVEEPEETIEVEQIEKEDVELGKEEDTIKDIEDKKTITEEKKKNEKIEILSKDFETIDYNIASLLFESGYTNVDSLIGATYKDLKKIKGLKRKKAKEITKEINKKIQERVDIKPIEMSETAKGEVSKDEIEEKDFIEEKKEGPSSVEFDERKKHWEPVDEEDEIEEEIPEQITTEELKKEKPVDLIEGFEKIDSIDEKIANLLYESGYKSIDELKDITYKDLKKIKGIDKKTAKKIITDLNKLREDDEWETIDSDAEVNLEKKEESIPKENKIDIFKEIENIDNETAIILYDNGFISIEEIRESSIDDICKIKGIKKRKVKKIKKEINKKFFSEDEEKSDKEFSEYLIEEDIERESNQIDEKIKNFVTSDENIEEEFFEEEKEEVPIKKDEQIFKDIDSIDDKIEKLLIENNIDSIEKLRNATIKDLTKIKGIRRKIAKKIKKDLEKISESEEEFNSLEENPFIEEETSDEDEWEFFETNESSDTEEDGYKHKSYRLYEKVSITKKGNKRKIRFFSKKKPDNAKAIKLPKGYIVKENKKTGVPYLKKKK